MNDRFRPARITDRILQNGYISEVEAARLRELGVTHVLNLDLPYGARVDLSASGLKVVELLLHDMAAMKPDEARRVVAVFQRALELEGGTIYVHCNAGLSRSPTAAWLYLVACGMELEAATARVAAAAPHLSGPDPLLLGAIDVDDLRRWARRPRWELWRAAAGAHDHPLALFEDRPAAEAELARLEERQRQDEARGRPWRIRYRLLEWLPPPPDSRPSGEGAATRS